MANSIRGKNYSWEKVKPVGKGDAGEVYLVRTSSLDSYAVMKCPARVATGGNMSRQAMQIEREGRILEVLNGLNWVGRTFSLQTPALVDQSMDGLERTSGYFIVSEQARGVSLDDMLQQALIFRTSISQGLLLKIIHALFQLFELTQQKHILWNDVKPAHIFWDQQSQTVMIIDWGNGMLLEDAESVEEKQVMVDYGQFFSEFSGILQNTYPQLIDDLGWPQSATTGMTISEIHTLKRRVEFLENYYEMEVIENRALVRSLQEKAMTVSELNQLLACQEVLKQLGETVDNHIVHEVAERLIMQAARNLRIDECEAILEIVSSVIRSQDEIEWLFVGEIVKRREKIAPQEIAQLFGLVFAHAWVELHWQLNVLGLLTQNRVRANKLILELRHRIFPDGYANSTLMDLTRELADSLNARLIQLRISDAADEDFRVLVKISKDIAIIIKNWDKDGLEDFYSRLLTPLRSSLHVLALHSIEIPPNLEAFINSEEEFFREMMIAWDSGDFPEFKRSLHTLAAWDPDLRSIKETDLAVNQISSLMSQLLIGPGDVGNAKGFLRQVSEKFSKISFPFSPPGWLANLLHGLEDLLTAQTTKDFLETLKINELPLPWIDDHFDLNVNDFQEKADDELSSGQKLLLNMFCECLKNEDDPDQILGSIKREIGWAYPAYAELKHAFDKAFFPGMAFQQMNFADRIPAGDRFRYDQALSLLQQIRSWVDEVDQNRLITAGKHLPDHSDWKLIRECQKSQNRWQQVIIPYLARLKQKRWETTSIEQTVSGNLIDDPLGLCINELSVVKDLWTRIREGACEGQLISKVIDHLDLSQGQLLLFQNDPSNSRPHQFLMSIYHGEVSLRIQEISLLLTNARGLQRALTVINNEEMLLTSLANKSAEDLMFYLENLNNQVPGYHPKDKITQWSSAYKELMSLIGSDEFDQALLMLDTFHPLSKWFYAKRRLSSTEEGF